MIAIPTAAYFEFQADEFRGLMPAVSSQTDVANSAARNAADNRHLPHEEAEPVARCCQDDQFLWQVLGSWDL